jgi:hypothetical protein
LPTRRGIRERLSARDITFAILVSICKPETDEVAIYLTLPAFSGPALPLISGLRTTVIQGH